MRDLPYLRDPAVLLIDQLKEVYIDGDLETVDTTIYLPKLLKRILSSDWHPLAVAPIRIRTSTRFSVERARRDHAHAPTASARPGHRHHCRCRRWQPYVKGLTIMVNSITNGWRMEDVWLDK